MTETINEQQARRIATIPERREAEEHIYAVPLSQHRGVSLRHVGSDYYQLEAKADVMLNLMHAKDVLHGRSRT